MKNTETTKEELTTFIHDLFLNKEYLEWRKGLKSATANEWHSLIANLHRMGAPLERIRGFGENIYSKLVFSYTKAPDYKKSKLLMVQFTVSESIWHSIIWHCPERNEII